MRSTIRVEDLRFSFPFQRLGAVVLQGKPLNWFDTCSCWRRVSQKMCDDQHEQVEQTETTDVQKKTLSKAFVLHFPLFRNKRIQGTQ